MCDDTMTCPYCWKPAQVADYVSGNLERYGKSVRARTECCKNIIRVRPIFRMCAETTEQGGKDDWGR